MEAHDALSAMIAERSGFAGIWASGLSIATALGLRDANEASWSQVVDVIDGAADPDFVVVARIEALIAGYGQDEARTRALAYAEAGADAILIHSRRQTADEIPTFAKAWDRRCPIVIVPTKYYSTPVSAYREAGISTVIWANHNMRAAAAMFALCERVQRDESVAGVEQEIAPLDSIFDLLNYAELSEAERRYLPARSE